VIVLQFWAARQLTMLQSFNAATLSSAVSRENEAIRSEPVVQAVCSLPIPRRPRATRAGFLLARIGPVDGIRIPPLPLVMPDHRWEIQPNNDILRTMLLRFGFIIKCLERERWDGHR
jgi:hypothetical protein